MKPMEAQTKIKLQRFRLQRLLAGEGERQRECERTVGLGITRRNSLSMVSDGMIRIVDEIGSARREV
jgi:hypothetical protein